MTCDEAFDVWYAMQRHQLVNEELCRLIFRRGWEAELMQDMRNPPFVAEWHAKAVALGYDGVADMLDSVERGQSWTARLENEVSEWQPIGTAPRDGTEIDVWDGTARVCDVAFVDRPGLGPGFQRLVNVCSYRSVAELTHWMPVPMPPNVGGNPRERSAAK